MTYQVPAGRDDRSGGVVWLIKPESSLKLERRLICHLARAPFVYACCILLSLGGLRSIA
jgi:hypothetical protein